MYSLLLLQPGDSPRTPYYSKHSSLDSIEPLRAASIVTYTLYPCFNLRLYKKIKIAQRVSKTQKKLRQYRAA